jgi:pantoate--beta-alanine ligase
MNRARKESDSVVVSLFVNPTQFLPGEDLAKYPRDFAKDAELAEMAGVDYLFAPDVSEIYKGPGTTLRVEGIRDLWEGAIRPGHFDGVATVVCKLLHIVQPTVSYFGLKDLQQCMVLRRMVEDLNLPFELSFQPTVRENDGLAMSSRNRYLSPAERASAPLLQSKMRECIADIEQGVIGVQAAITKAKRALAEAGFVIDYLQLVSLPDMQAEERVFGDQALIAAARLGSTRLIDNIIL